MPSNKSESDLETGFRNARDLIASGRISTLEELYNVTTKKNVAKGLGVNPVSFTNNKANQPEAFRLSEILKLSELLETDVHTIVSIFLNSIK